MRAYLSVFFYKSTSIKVKKTEPSGVVVKLEDAEDPDGDLSIFFDTQEDLDRFADQVYHARMDSDAIAMQEASPSPDEAPTKVIEAKADDVLTGDEATGEAQRQAAENKGWDAGKV